MEKKKTLTQLENVLQGLEDRDLSLNPVSQSTPAKSTKKSAVSFGRQSIKVRVSQFRS
jgi:hypothetical protein